MVEPHVIACSSGNFASLWALLVSGPALYHDFIGHSYNL